MNRLQGKRALITGGASGIGRATAERFAEEGARVIVADIAGDRAEAVARELPGRHSWLEMDITSEASISEGIAETERELGGLDVLVNNAGVQLLGSVADLSTETWEREIATNLSGAFLLSRAAWPLLERDGGGVVLSTASVAAIAAFSSHAAYNASKAGIVALTRSMAADGATVGIRANCVCPGNIDTPMVRRWLDEHPTPEAAMKAIEDAQPLRLGLPRDIANAYLYLASDEAEWVAGASLVVDGGLTAVFPDW